MKPVAEESRHIRDVPRVGGKVSQKSIRPPLTQVHLVGSLCGGFQFFQSAWTPVSPLQDLRLEERGFTVPLGPDLHVVQGVFPLERGIVNGRFTIGDSAKKSPEGRPDDIHLLFTHWLWEFGGSVRYQAKEVIRVGDPFGCVLGGVIVQEPKIVGCIFVIVLPVGRWFMWGFINFESL